VKTHPPRLQTAARLVLAYLAETDPLPGAPADVILGFGMFDLTLPRFCGELYRQRRAPRLLFTGGIGAGTGDLGGPEADAWRQELYRVDPTFPDDHLIIENRSTNTTENIQFSAALLESQHPPLAFGRGLNSAIIVASPSRLRRVKLALAQFLPALATTRALPAYDFDREEALYAGQGLNYLAHLTGELDRIVTYPARGWIADEPLPGAIREAHQILRAALAVG
jgi:uncharacterized SAM-binding protein YcdF (DUF218 family)